MDWPIRRVASRLPFHATTTWVQGIVGHRLPDHQGRSSDGEQGRVEARAR